MFDQIQKLEKQKWEFVSFTKIWYDGLGVNVHLIESYFNSSIRQSYTSQKFFAIENNANGYFLNTLQFYLSHSIIVFGIFAIGNIAFEILKKFRFYVRSLFAKFQIWIAFPIVLLEGSIQFMTYLMGF